MKENRITQPEKSRSLQDCGFSDDSNMHHAVSLSGGKASSYLLLLIIEKGMPIDTVPTANTVMEFPEMQEHLSKLDDYLYREREMYHYYPSLWKKLMELDSQTRKPCGLSALGRFKSGWKVEELEQRFIREESEGIERCRMK